MCVCVCVCARIAYMCVYECEVIKTEQNQIAVGACERALFPRMRGSEGREGEGEGETGHLRGGQMKRCVAIQSTNIDTGTCI